MVKCNEERIQGFNKEMFWKESTVADFINLSDFAIDTVIVYLDIEFPILFSYECEGKIYLVYVLSYCSFTDENNFVSVEVESYEDILNMIESKVSIYEIFNKNVEAEVDCFSKDKLLFLGRKNGRLIKREVQLSTLCEGIPTLEENLRKNGYVIADLLPDEDFKLSYNLLNRINLYGVKELIESFFLGTKKQP